MGAARKKYRSKATGNAQVLTIKMALSGSKPLIWRRIQILDSATLGDLHYTIQIAMGWQNCHMHEFTIAEESYSATSPFDFGEGPENEEEDFRLCELLKSKNQKFAYMYDFGDGWDHELCVESIAPPDPAERYPVCVDGARACPFEDSGGLHGYYRILKILANPTHKDYEEMRDWAGPDTDPAAFDTVKVNRELDRLGWWRAMAEGDEG